MYQNISQGVASPLLLLFLGPGDWEDMQYNLTITGLVHIGVAVALIYPWALVITLINRSHASLSLILRIKKGAD